MRRVVQHEILAQPIGLGSTMGNRMQALGKAFDFRTRPGGL
jgi:hypothetical protein